METKELLNHTSRRSILAALGFIDFLGGSVNLLYSTLKSLFRPPFYFRLLVEQLYQLGFKSLSLTTIM
ncbi:hypothetical protein K2X33_03225, partial [bacterium]|nr:hypothetical protein [bacterium]